MVFMVRTKEPQVELLVYDVPREDPTQGSRTRCQLFKDGKYSRESGIAPGGLDEICQQIGDIENIIIIAGEVYDEQRGERVLAVCPSKENVNSIERGLRNMLKDSNLNIKKVRKGISVLQGDFK